MVLHIRYISGTLDFVPVNYYYNTVLNNIIMEYIIIYNLTADHFQHFQQLNV